MGPKCVFPHKTSRVYSMRFTKELWDAIDSRPDRDEPDPRTGRPLSVMELAEEALREKLDLPVPARWDRPCKILWSPTSTSDTLSTVYLLTVSDVSEEYEHIIGAYTTQDAAQHARLDAQTAIARAATVDLDFHVAIRPVTLDADPDLSDIVVP